MSEKYTYDVLYLGSGHGSFNGAIPLAASGKKVGVIESGKIGGVCPNRGCNAKIALDMPVMGQHDVQALQGQGLIGVPNIDWKADVLHKDAVIGGIPDGIAGLMEHFGIQIINGYGKLTSPHSIEVDGKEYTADKIVIATGAHYHRLNIPGDDLAHDGTEFMDLKELPDKMVILGSGYIAMEFANIAAAAGSDVTVLMHHDVALRKFYQPFVKDVMANMEKAGVKFVENVDPTSIERISKVDKPVTIADDDATNDEMIVKTNQGDFESDWVLDATGRPANTEGFGLDEVGVKYNKNGIEVNDHLQTSVDNIYAAGDVLDKKVGKLTPTAIFESTYLTGLLSGANTDPIDYPAVPSAVFTTPRIAQVGVSIDEAEKDTDKYKIKTIDLATDWFRAAKGENAGTAKIVYNKDGFVVGAAEVSDQAEDFIGTILPAIELNLTPKQIQHVIPLFPTISSESWTKL